MAAIKPSPEQFWAAIDLYMQHAYCGLPPESVRRRLETLRTLSADELYASPLFEMSSEPASTRLSLRLGNRLYPHMKLVLESSPDGKLLLFRADAHDRHCCPAPGSREFAAFTQLMESNEKIAQEIESTWAAAQIPTFKTYLREDLARRQAARGSP